MNDQITVYIADDHPLFRRGVHEVIEENARFRLVGEAGDGEGALKDIRRLLPDVAVLDVEMPKLSGLDVARSIQRDGLGVSVILLTVHDEDVLFHKAREYGVMGYILKDSASEDLHVAIESVAAGDGFISAAVMKHAMRSKRQDTSGPNLIALDSLTVAERNVLRLIAEHKSTKEIAAELNNSPRTIGNHRVSICHKLNLHGALTLVRFAVENRERIGMSG